MLWVITVYEPTIANWEKGFKTRRIKKSSPSEAKNIPIARKSIVAIKPIKKGELFTIDNIGIKRPDNGISPMRWYEILGNVAQKAYKNR